LQAGGHQAFELNAGAARAGDLYVLLGSISGTTPGVSVDRLVIPLNPFDPYFGLTLLQPAASPLTHSIGLLDAGGCATARFALLGGSNPALAGIDAAHAYLAFDVGGEPGGELRRRADAARARALTSARAQRRLRATIPETSEMQAGSRPPKLEACAARRHLGLVTLHDCDLRGPTRRSSACRRPPPARPSSPSSRRTLADPRASRPPTRRGARQPERRTHDGGRAGCASGYDGRSRR
jgi:hypothetical protein